MPPEAARTDAPNGTNTMRKSKLAAASRAAIADASTRALVTRRRQQPDRMTRFLW
jgi:hypothetical protein